LRGIQKNQKIQRIQPFEALRPSGPNGKKIRNSFFIFYFLLPKSFINPFL